MTVHKIELVRIEDAALDQVAGGLGSPIVPSPAVLPAFLIELALGHGGGSGTGTTQPPKGLFGLGGLFGIF